jgi:hypothetical protein
MGKILEAFRKFKHDVHELDNAEKLKTMLPSSTVYDMQHNFSNRKKNGTCTDIFDKVLNNQPLIGDVSFVSGAYPSQNAQNQVLYHGIIFNALFNVYMRYVKKGFDSIPLSEAQKATPNARIIIDFIEYDDLPKRYRDIFVQYDADHYMLNVTNSEMVIAYSNKNKQKLESLLLRAKMLIPVIYKHKSEIVWNDEPEAENHNLWTGTKVQVPAFVKDSPFAKLVNDEQLATVRELHDIFVEISKITLPIATKRREDSAAFDKIAEIHKEYNQYDIFLRAQKQVKESKAQQITATKNAFKQFKSQKKQLAINYKQNRSYWLTKLANETSVRIK